MFFLNQESSLVGYITKSIWKKYKCKMKHSIKMDEQ